jgi:hypothetical protein
MTVQTIIDENFGAILKRGHIVGSVWCLVPGNTTLSGVRPSQQA